MEQHQRPADDGYTMLEVVIAMAIFTILAGSVFGVLMTALRVTGDNNHRTVAADLASAQVEQARGTRALDIPDGLTTRTQAVGGTTYTISQTANYLASDATSAVCVGTGDNLAYKLVSVQVTWPAMGTTKPVTAKTLRSLGLGTDGLDAGTGAFAVVVQGANSNPVSGTVVTLSPGGASRTTGTDGCAVFTGLTPRAYTATIDQAGRVASTGLQATTTGAVAVTAGRVQRASVYQDVSRTQAFTLAPPAGYTVPSGLSVVFRDSYLDDQVAVACGGSPVRSCTTGVPGQLQSLFPDTYALWAGTCSDAEDTSPATFDATPASGSGTSVAVPLGGVAASATSLTTGPQQGVQLWAVHAAEAAEVPGSQCAAGETYSLGASQLTPLTTALPLGTWTITSTPSAPLPTDPVVVLSASSPTAGATVVSP